jgi:hypothetical protein
VRLVRRDDQWRYRGFIVVILGEKVRASTLALDKITSMAGNGEQGSVLI